ncbi:MAG: hypothetical protein O7A63_03595 [Acidobacteria bacterium]|nr:hypothetical protein [Acidobacteriota bacterium]
MNRLIVLPIMAVGLLLGCGSLQDGSAMRKARETSAFAELKKFGTAQNIVMIENGRFARSLEELQSFGGGLIAPAMVQASPRASPPHALNGFFFSEIVPRTSSQTGLAAYPATIGKTGDKIIMILIDEDAGPQPTEGRPISGDNSRIFIAQAKDVRLPITRWPSEADLKANWHEIRRRNPVEGMREAERIFADLMAGKAPKRDPVFGD